MLPSSFHFDEASRFDATSSERLFPSSLWVRGGKAPEGWRSPRRFARFGGQWKTRQRLGLRWPSTAFDSRRSKSLFSGFEDEDENEDDPAPFF
jgi:hypothetical protein